MINIYKKFGKRIIDMVISILLLPVLLIILIPTGLVILLEDRGNIFYNAERLGKDGKVFKMYKLRSMKTNAEDIRNEDGSTYNGENDPRLTKIGKIIRITSIDELPQIINVIKGDMSLIGPRPDLPEPLENYTEIERIKFQVKPGITGYNQAYYRNSISQKEKFANDVYYVQNVKLTLDIKILFKTITTVLNRDNIYVDNESNKQKILIIGASILQLPAITKAKEKGFYVTVVDYNPEAIGIKYADEYFNVSTNDIEGVVEIAKKVKPLGIMTLGTDMPMRSIAAATTELNLPGITYETAIKCTDKGEMIKIFKIHGIQSPWYYIIDTLEELKNTKLEYPCIIKPTDSSGSRGVILVDKEDELEKSYLYSKEYSQNGAVIVEEYMQGIEVSVEIIVIDKVPTVITVTDKLTTREPYFVEMGHSQPSQLSDDNIEEIKDLAYRATKSVSIENGAAHVEIMMTKSGAKVIELGARLGGDYITSHLVELSTGIDIVGATIDVLTGKKPELEIKYDKASAIRYLNPSKGIIKSIEGIEDAKKVEGVELVVLTKSIGDSVIDIKSSTDRIGFVIAKANSSQEAIRICEEAISKIKITTV